MQNRPLDMYLICRSVDKMIHKVNNQKNEHRIHKQFFQKRKKFCKQTEYKISKKHTPNNIV